MANDFPSVLNSPSNKSQNWEVSENFPGHKTAAPDCFDKYLLQNISVVSHKKCRQHFHSADGGKLYIISG